MRDLEGEVRRLIVAVLGVAPPSELVRENVDAWDSLKHMEIVFALEDRYGVTFDESEFSLLDSPARISAMLERHLAP